MAARKRAHNQVLYNSQDTTWFLETVNHLENVDPRAIKALQQHGYSSLRDLCFDIIDAIDLKKITGINDGFAQQIITAIRMLGLDIGMEPNDDQKKQLSSNDVRIKRLVNVDDFRHPLHGFSEELRVTLEKLPHNRRRVQRSYTPTKEISAGLLEWFYENPELDWLGGCIYERCAFHYFYPGVELTPWR